jgi:hypothetical protein
MLLAALPHLLRAEQNKDAAAPTLHRENLREKYDAQGREAMECTRWARMNLKEHSASLSARH